MWKCAGSECCVCIDFIATEVQLYDVDHRNETVEITRRTMAPVLPEICEHIDMISEEV